jgi:serine/threonine protein phosphatase PrpC
MGAYLSQPNLYKESVDNNDDEKISFGASSMQGWRLSQEDAHNSIVNFDSETKTSFFAVYDGHGGPEVAAYCAKYLPDFLKQLKEYENSNLEDSLKKLFLKFDESLLTPEAQKELKDLREEIETKASNCFKKQNDKEEENEEEEEDAQTLTDEDEAEDKVLDSEDKTPSEQTQEADEDDPIDDDGENVAKLYDEATMPLEEVLKRYSNTENKVKKALKKKGILKQTVGRPSPMINAAGSSGSGSNLKRKNLLISALNDLDNDEENGESGGDKQPLDFKTQEEEDISEIKKMSGLVDEMDQEINSSIQNHEEDYDEASNLCDLTESHKSLTHSNTTQEEDVKIKIDIQTSITPTNPKESQPVIDKITTSSTTPIIVNVASTNTTNLTPNKVKLNKEELKLSPIRKKSLSTSSLLDDLSSSSIVQGQIDTNCAANGNGFATNPANTNAISVNGNTPVINEENKENDIDVCKGGSSIIKTESECATEVANLIAVSQTTDEATNEENDAENADEAEKKSKISNKKKSSTSIKSSTKQQIARFIAGWVNQKNAPIGKFNKKDVKNLAKISNTLIKNGKEGENEGDDDDEDDEDDAEYKGGDEESEDSGDDDDDDDDDEATDDDDDDDSDDDDDYEEEDDDEEDADIDPNQGMETRPGLDSGCTAVVALLRDNKHLYVANAGDSRCVVCRQGKAIDMSIDHKPEDELERNRIEKAGGEVTKDGRVNNGLNLSRAIGDHAYKTKKELPLEEQMITSYPDVKYLEIDAQKDTFMVLACDGIWNFMSSQEVCDYIQERLDAVGGYTKLSQICEELFMHCLAPDSEGDGTGCDNMTCIIATFNPFKRVEVKLNNSQENKSNLKRTLVESEKGVSETTGDETKNDNLNLKKLKSEESL